MTDLVVKSLDSLCVFSEPFFDLFFYGSDRLVGVHFVSVTWGVCECHMKRLVLIAFDHKIDPLFDPYCALLDHRVAS